MLLSPKLGKGVGNDNIACLKSRTQHLCPLLANSSNVRPIMSCVEQIVVEIETPLLSLELMIDVGCCLCPFYWGARLTIVEK
jgi:hypothetical protein